LSLAPGAQPPAGLCAGTRFDPPSQSVLAHPIERPPPSRCSPASPVRCISDDALQHWTCMASATALLRRASFFLLDKYTVCLHPQLCPSFPAPPSLPKSPPQPHAEHLNYAWQQSIELRARHRQPVCPDGLAMPCSPLPPTPPPLPASSQGARVSICLRASGIEPHPTHVFPMAGRLRRLRTPSPPQGGTLSEQGSGIVVVMTSSSSSCLVVVS
jgi:hypothetical protein